MPGASALRAAVEAELEGVSLHELRHAVEALSASYRSAPTSAPTLDDAQRLAYLAVRMPATHAAMATVLAEAARTIPGEVASLIDLGAGPGTTLWAAADAFPSLTHATLVDRDAAMLTLGAQLWRRHPRAPGLQVVHQAEAIGTRQATSADVVTMSYVLGELAGARARDAVDAAFTATRLAIVIVEPGTPRGYQAILEARAALIEKGAVIVAPCPHARACPLTGADWCHFAARLERSRAHRLLKDATLAWEDEKYLVPDCRASARAGLSITHSPAAADHEGPHCPFALYRGGIEEPGRPSLGSRPVARGTTRKMGRYLARPSGGAGLTHQLCSPF